jgi:hypothetical protein
VFVLGRRKEEQKEDVTKRAKRGPKSAPGSDFLSPEVRLFQVTIKESLLWWLSLSMGQRVLTWRIERLSSGRFA